MSPCRYSGSAYADNLAIIAHTYHFGKLSSLALDATVTFTDMENNVFRYVVREKNTISPNDANEIAHSGYDLTLDGVEREIKQSWRNFRRRKGKKP